jgi:CRP-like cAMP-binding protein
MSEAPAFGQNQILDALPLAERERLFPHLKLVPMPLGMVLYESGDSLNHIYFPTDSIVSLMSVLRDGASAEIAVVGNDGAIGLALFMGGETTTNGAIVKSAGSAFCLSGARLKEECGRHGDMLQILLRYTQALITQMAQELIANMLGVRREGFTEAAGRLQKLGVITDSRGNIEVLDRPQLERLSCECYAVVKTETDRLRPLPQP